MKAIVAVEGMQAEIVNVFKFIENLDEEMSEITTQVEQSVEMAERHLIERKNDEQKNMRSHISSKLDHSGSSNNKVVMNKEHKKLKVI